MSKINTIEKADKDVQLLSSCVLAFGVGVISSFVGSGYVEGLQPLAEVSWLVAGGIPAVAAVVGGSITSMATAKTFLKPVFQQAKKAFVATAVLAAVVNTSLGALIGLSDHAERVEKADQAAKRAKQAVVLKQQAIQEAKYLNNLSEKIKDKFNKKVTLPEGCVWGKIEFNDKAGKNGYKVIVNCDSVAKNALGK